MKKMTLYSAFLTVSLTAFSFVASAEVVVIVNPANKASVNSDAVKRIFLGKAKSFPGGGSATPVDQAEGSVTRDKFYDSYVGKNASQLKAYWAQLIFSGKGTPPNALGGDSDVRNFVAKNPNAIGYVEKAAADSTVKIVGK